MDSLNKQQTTEPAHDADTDALNLKAGSGGAAMAGGSKFQHRCAACAAAKVVAESAASPGWGLPDDVTLEFLRCESEQPVDDLMVGTSAGGHIFCQAKTVLSLSAAGDSEFGKTCDQFVRQYASHLGQKRPAAGAKPWERELDPELDRLVIMTGPEAPSTIRNHVPRALKRMCEKPAVTETVAQDEQHAADVLLGQIRRSFAIYKPNFDESDVSRLASMIRVQVLDVSDGGDAVRDAENLLRGVLTDASRAGEAFRLLDQTCEDLATRRSSRDRRGFKSILASSGVWITPAKSYAADIGRLRDETRETLGRVRRLSRIDAGPIRVKIQRAATAQLVNAAADGSTLVTGDPGTGKSGIAHDAAEALLVAGHDVVALAADQLAAKSLGQLRNELGIQHSLTDVLAEWDGNGTAYLLIDAIDAARSVSAADTLRQLMREVMASGGRWHIIAVMRQYDLRHSSELQRLFRNPASVKSSSEDSRGGAFSHVRHVFVRPFDETELLEVAAQSAELGALLTASDGPFRSLLAEPFNLAIAAVLLDDGVGPEELAGFRSQGQLLDRYWEERVRKRNPDDREAVLLRICRAMIDTRQLRADRRDVHLASTDALQDLLSSGPLVQWQQRRGSRPDDYAIAFSHNVIFDYAASRLLLRGTPQRTIEFLESAEVDLPVLLRPSLSMHARHLWGRDREAFWDFALRCAASAQLTDVIKLVAPTEAAALAGRSGDFDPVCAALESETPAPNAITVLRHLGGALQAGIAPAFGSSALPWYELMERASRIGARAILIQARQLVAATDDPPKMDDQQRGLFNVTARRLLVHLLQQEAGDRFISSVAIGAVCRSLTSAPAESAALIRQLLQPERLTRVGSDELFWIANKIEEWMAFDLNLVETVFTAAFTAPPPSAEKTTLFDSQIFTLLSNRKQDFDVTLYALADHFPAFLRLDPVAGARSAAAAFDAYVRIEHLPLLSREIIETFQFHGMTFGLLVDQSCIWNSTTRDDQSAVRLLRSLMDEVRRLAAADDQRLKSVVLNALAGVKPAALWSEFLSAGAEYPSSLGQVLVEALTVDAILRSVDTYRAALALLKVVYAQQEPHQRAAIESAILAMREQEGSERARQFTERVATEMLLALPDDLLVSDNAQEARVNLALTAGSSSSASSTTSRAQTPTNSSDSDIDAEALNQPPGIDEERRSRKEADCAPPADAVVAAANAPVAAFVKRRLNGDSSAEAVPQAFVAAQHLHSVLRQEATTPACDPTPLIVQRAWYNLAFTAEQIADAGLAKMAADEIHSLRQMLLDASSVFGSEVARSTRLMAVSGLAHVAVDTDVAAAILTLTRDESPHVRLMALQLLPRLYRFVPQEVWQCLDERAAVEDDAGALSSLVLTAAAPLAHKNPARGHSILDFIHRRAILGGPALAEVAAESSLAIYSQWINHGHEVSGQISLDLARHPTEHSPALQRIIPQCRFHLVHGPVESPDPVADAIRERALTFVETLVGAAAREYESLKIKFRAAGSDEEREALRERYGQLGKLLHQLVSAIYFGSGAYDRDKATKAAASGQAATNSNEFGITDAQRRRLLHELGPSFAMLARIDIVAVSHRLIETLSSLAQFDPAGVFVQIRDVVSASTAAGLQFESLAASAVAKLVEMYLVEHRTLLQSSTECRKALLDMLQAFIDWPEARRLVYRLDEIDR